MKDFKELLVWRKAHDLTLEIYRVTSKFPREELYGLTSQMRRASSSIAANIAEGCGRKSQADFARFLQNAFGSASELEYFLLLSSDLGLLKTSDYEKLTNDTIEVKKMLAAFMRKLTTDH